MGIEEIHENDHNLNIRRYADTSPPPEQFDVKAILRGGIPVSEVEEEYIQETLQGMDERKIEVASLSGVDGQAIIGHLYKFALEKGFVNQDRLPV